MSWEKVCHPKEEGRLGVKDIRLFNVVLLAKWKWRFLIEERGSWKEILVSKYGRESGSNQLPLKRQSWWWRDLIKVNGEGEGTRWVREAIGWKMGAGDKASFREDNRAGNYNFKTMFPWLYSLSLDKGKRGWSEVVCIGG